LTSVCQEIELQKQARTDLEKSIRELKTDVDLLKKDPKTNVREHMFPELFKKREK